MKLTEYYVHKVYLKDIIAYSNKGTLSIKKAIPSW